jgi:AP-2 complex subunit beta-1
VSKPAPPIPSESQSQSSHLLDTSESPLVSRNNDNDDSSDGEEDEDIAPHAKGQDPYSNLAGAFGNYLADEPRPMNNAGRNREEDDLLF